MNPVILEQSARLIAPLLSATDSGQAVPHWFVKFLLAMSLLLGFAFLFQGMWNGVMAEFPQIGRLSYLRAVHIVSIVGLCLSVLAWILL